MAREDLFSAQARQLHAVLGWMIEELGRGHSQRHRVDPIHHRIVATSPSAMVVVK